VVNGPGWGGRAAAARRGSRSKGTMLAFHGNGSGVQLVDGTTGELRFDLKASSKGGPPAIWAELSPDGSKLLTVDLCGVWKIWDSAEKFGAEPLRREHGGPCPLLSGAHRGLEPTLAVSPCGKMFALGFGDDEGGAPDDTEGVRLTTIWDMETGEVRLTLPARGGEESCCESLSFSEDGTLLASTATMSHEICIFNTTSGVQTLRIQDTGPVFAARFSPTEKNRLASGGLGGVKIWDVETGAWLLTLLEPEAVDHHLADFKSLPIAFSHDGRLLASGGFDMLGVFVWDAYTGEKRLRVDAAQPPAANLYQVTLAFSPNGKILATGQFGSGGTSRGRLCPCLSS